MARCVSPLPLGDGPESAAARMMGLPVERFRELLPGLQRRNFPLPDYTTGLYDLDAIATWRQQRHPALYRNSLANEPAPGNPAGTIRPRFEALSG